MELDEIVWRQKCVETKYHRKSENDEEATYGCGFKNG
jgi:hypothetical protein